MKKSLFRRVARDSQPNDRYQIFCAVVEDFDYARRIVHLREASDGSGPGPRRFRMKNLRFPTLCHAMAHNEVRFGKPDEVFRADVCWKRGRTYMILARPVPDRSDRRHFAVAFTTLQHYNNQLKHPLKAA